MLRLLATWGATHDAVGHDGQPEPAAAAGRHDACGTPVEARWYCPTCARVVGDTEISELRYL